MMTLARRSRRCLQGDGRLDTHSGCLVITTDGGTHPAIVTAQSSAAMKQPRKASGRAAWHSPIDDTDVSNGVSDRSRRVEPISSGRRASAAALHACAIALGPLGTLRC